MVLTTVYHIAGFINSLIWYAVTCVIQRLTGYNLLTDDDGSMASVPTTADLAARAGYNVREHVVTTKDGYILVLHKLELAQPTSGKKGVVYFHHGLLTDSETWVVGDVNLAYMLVDQGYQVWLGNNRGNRYLRKHLRLSPSDKQFWNFSLDEYAMYDIPASLEHIYQFNNGTLRITYVGFSQGCSQLLATLSLRPDLNNILNLFVGLLPAVIPQNLSHPIFKMIVNRSSRNNQFLYSLFGTRAIFPSVAYWQTWKWYLLVVDTALQYLFGWKLNNISSEQRSRVYPHLFSNTLVKLVHHWFQIIDAKRFQMFDEHVNIGLLHFSNYHPGHQVPPFPIAHHLDVPMVLVFGDADILVDINHTTKLITENNPQMKLKMWEVIDCPTYEHMDTLWASDVEKLYNRILPHIERANRMITDSDSTLALDEGEVENTQSPKFYKLITN
ncbi:alpha/beta fold hydrolase [Kocuria palustris]|nr:alpha/beta fold hydrolase [Kocuria palustris]